MTRNVSTQSIVLCVRKAGENNSTVTLLSRDYGILYATLYGGPRSRLRPRVSQWNGGVAHLYLPHTGHTESGVKITDFDVSQFHLSFRECIYKDYAASVAAEAAIATKCAGNAAECFTLVSAFLDGLEATADAAAQKAAFVRFLWRYLSLLGVQCDAATCAVCGESLGQAVYDEAEDGFVCRTCAASRGEEQGMQVSAEAVRYLAAVRREKASVSRAMAISGSALGELKALMIRMLQNAVGHPLKSIRSGVGIL